MAATMRIPTEFTAVDKFSAVIAKMTSGVSNFTKTTGAAVQRVNTKINGMFSSLDRISQLAIGVGVAGLFTMAASAAMDYETAMHSLEAVTGQSAAKYKSQIEDLAKTNRKSVIDVAGSFEIIGSAMSQYLDNPKALGQISQAGITLAKASRQELEPALQSLTSVMNQFKMGAEEANKTINILTAGEIVGSVSTTKIAEGLQEFGANAYTANVKLSESVALLETLGKQMDHSKIAVGARNLLNVMSSAKGLPKEAIKSLQMHGVSMDVLMNKSLPLGARLKELSKIQKDAVAITNVFGKENMTAANVIFSNLDTYNKWSVEIEKTNKANEQAAVNSDTLATKIKWLKDSFVNAIATNDKAATSMNVIKDVFGFLGDNMKEIVSLVSKVIIAFLAFKIINAIILTAQAIMAGYTAVMLWYSSVAVTAAFTGASFAAVIWATVWPILAVIAAIGLIVYAVTHWGEITDWFSQKWEQLTTFLSEFDFVGMFISIGQAIIDYMLFPLKSVLKLVSMIPGGIGKAAQTGLDKINEMSDLNMMVGHDIKKLDSPEQTNAKMMQENRVSGGIDVNIRDKGGNVESSNPWGNSGIPINVTSTQGAF